MPPEPLDAATAGELVPVALRSIPYRSLGRSAKSFPSPISGGRHRILGLCHAKQNAK